MYPLENASLSLALVLLSDYRPIPHLDVYDANVVDDAQQYDNISAEARLQAEKEMRKRDRQEALATGRTRPGLLYGQCRQQRHLVTVATVDPLFFLLLSRRE